MRLRLWRDRTQRAARLTLLEEHLGGPPAPEVLEQGRAVLHGPPASRAVG
ncbi:MULTISPECIES: hypothetical protein [Actinosynnema]|nr:hypothetical protein [Actinosynnema pretiosum]